MKKNSIMIAVIAVFAAASGAMAGGTMGNLAGTGDKLTAIDMKKDFAKAGSVLDGVFSGAAARKGLAETAVYAPSAEAAGTGAARNINGQTAKELCNAETPKRAKLGSAVNPLTGTPGKAGALADQAKSTFLEDLDTVTDYVGNVGGAAVDVILDVAGDQSGDHNIIQAMPDAIDLILHATCND